MVSKEEETFNEEKEEFAAPRSLFMESTEEASGEEVIKEEPTRMASMPEEETAEEEPAEIKEEESVVEEEEKPREEIAKDYVTREQIEADFDKLMASINKIDEKLDRLQSKTYFQE